MTFKETRGFCKLKEEALDRTLWRTLFERGYGHVTRQRRNECMGMYEKDQYRTFERLDEELRVPQNYFSEKLSEKNFS